MAKKHLSLIFAVLILILSLCGCKEPTVLPEDFSLSKSELIFTKPKDTATIYDGDIPSEQITWGSDDSSVATFKDGVVTATGIGSTRVYAEYFGIQYNCYVDCTTLQYTADMLPVVPKDQSDYSGEAVLAPPAITADTASYFDDAIFIGDSISLKLSYYAESTGELGDAIFLVSGSYALRHAIEGTMDVYFQGKEMSPADAIAASKAKKVFVMLGMNDLNVYGVDETVEKWGIFINDIKEKNPDVSICIQSMTPIYAGGESGVLTNENVNDYNEKLKVFARENGCCFMDIASFMKDSSGALASDYCSDNFVHLTDAGAKAWSNALNAYAGY